MSSLTEAVERRFETEHATVLESIDRCAGAVTSEWDGDTVSDSQQVVDPLRDALRDSGVHRRLPTVLEDLVTAAGYSLPASPVAAPPYVVISSRGPMLRGTIEPGRLVVEVRAFTLSRDEPSGERGYRRLEPAGVRVTLR